MRQWQPRGGGIGFGMGMTPAVKSLLIANGVVFVLQTLLGGGLSQRLGLVGEWMAFIPHAAINDFQIWRFFTYMFLHGSFTHILFNMFALWMFGSQIEALWGQRSFLAYYFTCGLGGSFLYGIFNLVGWSAFTPMLGASAAIFGVLLAYGMTFPNNIILFMFILPIKAKYFVILYGLIELFSIPSNNGVAHLAHLGGMITGFVFLWITMPSLRPSGLNRSWRNMQTRKKIHIVKPDSGRKGKGGNGSAGEYEGPKPGYTWDPQKGYEKTERQSRIDEILDKISREGLQSLTEEEQDILRRAGRK